MSTAMMREQPATTAAMTALSPTAPAPNTAMVLPSSGEREFSTPPAPVWMPQPSGPNSSSGTDGSTLTTLRSVATAYVANEDSHARQHQLPGHGPGAVLTQLLESVVDGALARSDTAVLLGHATIDLLTGLAYEHDAPVTPDDALRVAVLGYIREHLGDPDLGVPSIAHAHGISSRTLHRLFAGEEWTVSETIRNLRLDAVRSDLVNPTLAGRSIMAIAATEPSQPVVGLPQVWLTLG